MFYMVNKTLIIGAVLVVVLIAGFFILNGNNSSTGSAVSNPNLDDDDNVNDNNGNVKVFVVDGSNLRFYIDGVENPEIRVKEGDKIRIEFSSSEGFHDFVIDEFSVATKRLSAGGSDSVEFVASAKGEYAYYCSVGQHRANGMFGKFIVE